MTSKDCGKVKNKEHDCGDFKGDESKEEKLTHLKECKEDLLKRIDKIDATIKEIEG